MANWKYKLNIANIWKAVSEDKIKVYEFLDLFLKRLKKLLIPQDNELDNIINEMEFLIQCECNDKDDFDNIWEQFYDWADHRRLWVGIF